MKQLKKMEKDKEKVFLQSILKDSEPYREGIKVKRNSPTAVVVLKVDGKEIHNSGISLWMFER